MSDLTVLDKNNFAAMAEAMGMNADTTKSSGSTLARLAIDTKGVFGETSVKGKKKKVEIVSAGSYVLKKTDGTKLFQETVEIRLYSQRFQYELYKQDGDKKSFIRSVLAANFNSDLPDSAGGMNCGRQRGYVEDYNSLTQEQKDVKRVRVLFGEVKFTDAVDEEGNEVGPVTSPFIWDVKNNEAFKIMGQPITEMMEQQILLPERWISLETEERSSPSITWYVPTASLLPEVLPLGKEEQKLFADFNAWIKNSNEQTMSKHKSTSVAPATQSVEVLEDVVEEPEVRKVKKVAPVKSKQSDLGSVVDEIDNWDTDD